MNSASAKITTIGAILLACFGFIPAVHSQSKPLRIGVIVDGPWELNAEDLNLFQTEIRAELGSDYTVEVPLSTANRELNDGADARPHRRRTGRAIS